MGPISGNSAFTSEDRLPSSRGRTLNVSIALATLGLMIFLSASIWELVRATRSSSMTAGEWERAGRLDRVPALVGDEPLELRDGGLDLPQVRVDRERALEVHERALGLVEPQIDLTVAGQHTPVGGIALEHLVAVRERLL